MFVFIKKDKLLLKRTPKSLTNSTLLILILLI